MADSVRETWGRYAAAFAAEGEASEKRESMRRLVELCSLPEGSLVLDAGSGAGYTSFVFARTGCRPVALDPTHEMLVATRDGWRARRLPGEAWAVESWAESLPFRDGAFDAVVAHRAAHQFSDAAAFLREAARVVKTGGLVGVADQAPPDGWEQWHNDLERMRDPTHEHARSRREWRELVDGSGLVWEQSDVVYQEHDVEAWMDRVDCPDERRAACRRMLDGIPDEIRGIYAPEHRDGRLMM